MPTTASPTFTRSPSLPQSCNWRRPARRRAAHAAVPLAAAAAVAAELPQPHQKIVKVCGVTRPEDAEVAGAAGANLIGMILWPKARRSIPPAAAREIAAVARRHGAEPVAVFVDESAEEIARVCDASDVRIAQLHGEGARSALPGLPAHVAVVYVVHARADGTVVTPLPASSCRLPEWVLVDGLQGGSGQALDWQRLRGAGAAALNSVSSHGWLLAGGLGPGNVAAAIATVLPTGVDVSSGVCGPDGLAKDEDKVQAFAGSAWAAFEAQEQEQQAQSGPLSQAQAMGTPQ